MAGFFADDKRRLPLRSNALLLAKLPRPGSLNVSPACGSACQPLGHAGRPKPFRPSACSRYPRFGKRPHAAIAPRILDLWPASHRRQPCPELPCYFLLAPVHRSASKFVSSSLLSSRGRDTVAGRRRILPHLLKRKRDDNWLTLGREVCSPGRASVFASGHGVFVAAPSRQHELRCREAPSPIY